MRLMSTAPRGSGLRYSMSRVSLSLRTAKQLSGTRDKSDGEWVPLQIAPAGSVLPTHSLSQANCTLRERLKASLESEVLSGNNQYLFMTKIWRYCLTTVEDIVVQIAIVSRTPHGIPNYGDYLPYITLCHILMATLIFFFPM